MAKVNRRIFLVGGLATAGAIAVPGLAISATTAALKFPFKLGVASGDPHSDSVILWTRLAPTPLAADGHGGMPHQDFEVKWEVATDDKFTTIVRSDTKTARYSDAHSLHVNADGLKPDWEYIYRFQVAGHMSQVGRTRTAPAAGTMPAQLKFAFASCAHYERGWFHAYRGIADDRPDLVLFLGDYMYERSRPEKSHVRLYTPGTDGTKLEADTLAEYRLRYAEHRTGKHLQAAHAAAPWSVVFDDHEVVNDWAGKGGQEPSAERRAAAFRAYWENMPMRGKAPTEASIQLYRGIQWGALARFHMLDTRQYRNSEVAAGANCAVRRDPSRSILGGTQQQWLLDGFAAHHSRWDFLAQQVFFARREYDGDPATCSDNKEGSWDAFVDSRNRVSKGWMDHQVRNPVVLTGDIHRHAASQLYERYFDDDRPVIGTELVTSSVTSGGNGTGEADAEWYRKNPHIKYYANERGYVRVNLSPAEMTAQFMKVSSVTEKEAANVTITPARTFVVGDGQHRLENP